MPTLQTLVRFKTRKTESKIPIYDREILIFTRMMPVKRDVQLIRTASNRFLTVNHSHVHYGGLAKGGMLPLLQDIK